MTTSQSLSTNDTTALQNTNDTPSYIEIKLKKKNLKALKEFMESLVN